ncbi:MAG: carbohydrate-binding domain-containing protein [Ruminococcus sp.]|nr:carbohydrate-binding domain-containing protein [Ruminococcus sp.]
MKARIIGKTVSAFTAAAVLAASAAWSAFAYDTSDAVNTFTFTDDGITASSTEGGYEISGTDLKITSSGTYVVTGECVEGTITVKKGTTDVVLILDSLTLTSSTSSPVSINKGSSATIVIEGESTIKDAEDPANETSTDTEVADAFEGAAIKVKSGASLTITGDGTLNIDGSECKNGIKGGATSTITVGADKTDGFTLNINAANTGLAADGELIINGGNINVTADNDGIKSSPDDDDTDSLGKLTVNGGNITVTSGDDGIKGQNGADILGGTITVTAVDDGIKSDYVLNIGSEDGGEEPVITVISSYEGLEGAAVNLYSGSGVINSSDDGINAANGDLTDYDFELNIYGGSWYINADGDGLDSNGNINVSGGFTEVFGSSQGDNAALDYGDNGNGLYITGGTVVGIGMSQMANVPTTGTYLQFGNTAGQMGGMPGQQGGNQPGGTQPGGGNQPGGGTQPGQPGGQQSDSSAIMTSGDTIVIKDSSGNTVYESTAVKNADSLVFASTELDSSETYTLYVNGESVGTATVSEGTGSTSGQPGGGNQPPELPGSDQPADRIAGDANNDGEVDINDVLMIQQYIAQWGVEINLSNADVNADNEVDIDDVLLIQQYIAQWDVTLV